MRQLSSLLRRHVVTESGEKLGRCFDLRAELTGSSLRVTGLVVGAQGYFEHFGARRALRKAVPWDAVVRLEGKRIVVRDGTTLP